MLLKKIIISTTLLCFGGILTLTAQDIHFSQFWNKPLELNPALAGVSREDVRFFGAYKNQWQSVPVGYNTFSGAVDKKWTPNKSKNGFFGFGFLFTHDQAGDSDWTLNQLNGALAYTKQIKKGFFSTIGAQIGVGERSFTLENLTFDNQFNGDFFDPSLDTRESFSNTRTVFFDATVGLNLHFQKEDIRTKLDVGIGIHHLNTPSQNFYANSTIDIPIRKDIYVMGVLKLNNNLDLIANGLMRYQADFQEIISGAGLRVHLSTQRTKELALDFGGNLRVGDAILPYAGVLYKQWRVGFIYDINTSAFQNATRYNGGPEFTLQYSIIYPESPLKKLCPIF